MLENNLEIRQYDNKNSFNESDSFSNFSDLISKIICNIILHDNIFLTVLWAWIIETQYLSCYKIIFEELA